MTQRSTLPFQHKHHPLGVCSFCGARSDLYTTYLLATRSMAAVCEDPVSCLRNRQKRAT